MKYCSLTTKSHPLCIEFNTCIESINLLFIREGYIGTSPLFNPDNDILNLDVAESLVAAKQIRNKDKSMDFAFGISDQVSNLFVIAEIRLNYINPNNLVKEDLEGKVNGSLSLLGTSISILANYYFIFQDDKVQEARNRMFRIRPKIPNEYFAISIEQLKSTFFY